MTNIVKKRNLYKVRSIYGIELPNIKTGDLIYINGIDQKGYKFVWTNLRTGIVHRNAQMHIFKIHEFSELLAENMDYKMAKLLYG